VSALGTLLAAGGAVALGNPVVFGAAIALWLAAGTLLGVARAQAVRASRPERCGVASRGEVAPAGEGRPRLPDWADVAIASSKRIRALPGVISAVGGVAVVGALAADWTPRPLLSLVGAAACFALTLAGAGLAATSASYLATVDPERLPEAPGLSRGARLLGWVLVLAGAAVGLAWTGRTGAVRVLHLLVLALDLVACFELSMAGDPARVGGAGFPSNSRLFSVLGRRANPLASLVDAAEAQLGIDLRSTWALTVVRSSAVPLGVGLLVMGWLSTALTVVRVEEQGLVERLGVPTTGPALDPGLHAHWPWPIDRVARIPVRRVQSLTVGHEGEEEEGPEDILWARQHGSSEYTLLLGDGRDLIAVDAAVQFRISDPRAWRYRCQNPSDALRAIAYRAVMKSTVGRTLAETLSENVASLTTEMRIMVQADADDLGLGVEVVGFTVGGMHPPVRVAADYQAVVSAELDKTTAAIDAHAYRNEIVPAAEAEAIASGNAARADAAALRGRAVGEAWSFQALEAEYRAAPAAYRFRRRLEALEDALGGRPFTVLDARIQRDGGELWLMK
jgi:regulator of protease activity HflC (stomatin/prohibitin superfamily)